MRILIIDDHPLFSDGLSLLLQTLGVARSVQTCATAEQALQFASQHTWDLTLLDWNLNAADASGAALIEALQQLMPTTRVVVVSADASAATVQQAIHAGAVGFVPKETSSAQLIDAIRLTSEGGIYLPAAAPTDAAQAPPVNPTAATPQGATTLTAAFPQLTSRQIEVLVCALRGATNKGIAKELCIAEDTVKQHLKVVYRELAVRNRSEAIYLMALQGIRVF